MLKARQSAIAVLTLALLIPLAAAAPKKEKVKAEKDDPSKMKADTFAGLALRGIGPAMISGRITDIAVHPKDKAIRYVTVASGNVWKTTNAGTTWTPIFDDQGSYSIGCIT